jgi:hypothetical protein
MKPMQELALAHTGIAAPLRKSLEPFPNLVDLGRRDQVSIARLEWAEFPRFRAAKLT